MGDTMATLSDDPVKNHAKAQESYSEDHDIEQSEPKRKSSGVLNVIVSGLALFSDGYNAQISMFHRVPNCFLLTLF
jgi:hypothetical protein